MQSDTVDGDNGGKRAGEGEGGGLERACVSSHVRRELSTVNGACSVSSEAVCEVAGIDERSEPAMRGC